MTGDGWSPEDGAGYIPCEERGVKTWCAGYCGKMHPISELRTVGVDRMCSECAEKARDDP